MQHAMTPLLHHSISRWRGRRRDRGPHGSGGRFDSCDWIVVGGHTTEGHGIAVLILSHGANFDSSVDDRAIQRDYLPLSDNFPITETAPRTPSASESRTPNDRTAPQGTQAVAALRLRIQVSEAPSRKLISNPLSCAKRVTATLTPFQFQSSPKISPPSRATG